MYLLNDRARCHGKNCESRDTCERYLQRRTGGPQTPHYENMADGDVCGHYLEAAKKEQGMTDNTMREGRLWAFLRDSIHEAYKKLSTTGTSTEYHTMLDSIASKVADDVDARFLQAARTVPALHAEQIRVAAVAAIREVTGCPDIKGKDGAYLVDALIVNLLSAAPEPKK